MENNYSFVLIKFNPSSLELKEQLSLLSMNDFGCDGVEEFSLEEARVDEILGERAYSGGDVPETLLDEVEHATFSLESFYVKFYFQVEDNAKEFVVFIKENFSELPVHIEIKPIEDWNLEWKKYYTPIVVSENFEVIPEWLFEEYRNENKTQIIIYPGMGFGTGTHATTYLCLKLLDKYKEKISGKKCLDFGCGSGILGIGAIKTHQMSVEFMDIDKSALENCLQNLKINFDIDLLEGSSLVLRDRFQENKYDLIFANILENVLELELETIKKCSKKGTILIVSGLLNHQVENIIKKYNGFTHIETVSKGDWSAIIFEY